MRETDALFLVNAEAYTSVTNWCGHPEKWTLRRITKRSEVMSEPSAEEVRKLGLKRLGRPPTEAEAKRIGMQLASLAELGSVTAEWQNRLGEIEPATTYRVLSEVGNGQ
jgi:hypothetical protein